MSLLDVAEAVAFNPDRDPAFDEDDVTVDARNVIRICRGLFTTIRNRNGYLDGEPYWFLDVFQYVLAHYSVKEFLLSNGLASKRSSFSLNETKGQAMIRTSCVLSLLRFPCPTFAPYGKHYSHSFDDYAIGIGLTSSLLGWGPMENYRNRLKPFSFQSLSATCMSVRLFINWPAEDIPGHVKHWQQALKNVFLRSSEALMRLYSTAFIRQMHHETLAYCMR
jgi:hypothetical protein